MRFRCPICQCLFFEKSCDPRGDGYSYDTDFFQCMGCSVMFREPSLFSAAAEYRATASTSLPSMASDVSMLFQALDWRYWEARTTRMKGGILPTSQIVAEARAKRFGRVR